VQLEANYQPTPFEQRPYGVELQLCQRYYYRTVTSSAITYATFGNGSTATNSFLTTIHLPVPMRTNPTSFETSAAGTFYLEVPTSSGVPSSISATYRATDTRFQVLFAKTGLVAGEAGQLLQDNADSAYIAASAEL
jgi:hypothetical protein